MRAFKAAGVAYIKPNEMGLHFFGTHAVNDLGADIYPVQDCLGHTDPKINSALRETAPHADRPHPRPKGDDCFRGASNEKAAT